MVIAVVLVLIVLVAAVICGKPHVDAIDGQNYSFVHISSFILCLLVIVMIPSTLETIFTQNSDILKRDKVVCQLKGGNWTHRVCVKDNKILSTDKVKDK